MKIIIEDIETNKEAWLEARLGGISATDIPIILNLSPWCTPFKLWGLKTKRIPPDPDNQDKALGRHFQGSVAEWAEKAQNIRLRAANCLCANSNNPWMLASPDFWRLGDYDIEADVPDADMRWIKGICEVKNVGYRMAHEWEDGPPLYVQAQLQWQLGVCDIKRGAIAALVGGKDFHYSEHDFDQELFEDLTAKAHQFWYQFVIADIPPNATAPDLSLLKKLRTPEESIIYFPEDEARMLFAKWEELSEDIKQREGLEEARGDIKTRIVQLMGNSSIGKYKNYQVRLNTINRKESIIPARTETRFNIIKTEE